MIECLVGPMYSGKSSALFSKIERAAYAGKKIALVRPKRDTRTYFAHSSVDTALQKLIDKGKVSVFYTLDMTKLLAQLTACNDQNVPAFDRIYVDEYFMIKNCVVLAQNARADQNVCFAGLLASSEAQTMPEAVSLLPYCDEITKLNGVCDVCGSAQGNFSFYRAGIKKDLISVGDSEYLCVCRSCYVDLTAKMISNPEQTRQDLEKVLAARGNKK